MKGVGGGGYTYQELTIWNKHRNNCIKVSMRMRGNYYPHPPLPPPGSPSFPLSPYFPKEHLFRNMATERIKGGEGDIPQPPPPIEIIFNNSPTPPAHNLNKPTPSPWVEFHCTPLLKIGFKTILYAKQKASVNTSFIAFKVLITVLRSSKNLLKTPLNMYVIDLLLKRNAWEARLLIEIAANSRIPPFLVISS